MKKIYESFLFLLMVFAVSVGYSQSNPDWKWIHPYPQSQYLRWIKAVDANIWYAAGDYGMFLKTTNAGLNWRTSTVGYPSTLYPGAGILQNNLCGYFLNANTGFLGVQSVRGIAKTTNGGATFDTIQILPTGSGGTYGFSFINSQTGYLCGTSTLKSMKTENGGLNWTQLPNMSGITTTLYSVYASDTNNIKLASTSGNVYITTNAGLNWITSNVGTTNTLYNLNFINSNTGYVCGSGGLFRYTTNGGLNWTGTNPPTTSSLYNVVISGTDVYVSGYVSAYELYKTTDNGTTWTAVSYLGAPTITGFLAYSFDKFGNNMMLVGTYGEMIKSTDNGSNWSSMNYRVSLANMVDIYAQSNNGRVIAIGSNANVPDIIFYSSNGGNNWTAADYRATDNLSSIDMINSLTGYISGRWGRFAKTTNGGVTWDTSLTANPLLSPYYCNGVDFINVNTGWIVGGTPSIGGNTKIWKTTDGGVNWTEQVSAYSGPVGVKINMLNANTGYMTHSAGFQKTTNGGENWVLTSAPASGSVTYNNIKVIDSVTVYTGGNNSQVYGTTNGGVSWDSLNFPVKAGTIFTTDWYNKNIGVAGAVIGVVGRTTNRGQSWEIFNVGGYTIYSVKMVHPDTIFAVAGNTFGAMVFKYSRGTVTSGFTYESRVPTEYSLKQNYPNPFNPVTTIEFDLLKAAIVSIKIYDLAGREYSTDISNLNLIQGNYKLNFNGSQLSSGVYFYSLVVDGVTVSSKRMVLIK